MIPQAPDRPEPRRGRPAAGVTAGGPARPVADDVGPGMRDDVGRPTPDGAGRATRDDVGPVHDAAPAHAATWDAAGLVTRRTVTLVLSGALVAVLVLVMVMVPLPYVVQQPGPTVDTLSEHDGEPLIVVDGAETYPTSGELRLTTVSYLGGPGYRPVTALRAVAGWLDGTEVVLPREAVYPEDLTREQLDDRSTAEMASSQTSATVAALSELGYDIPMVLTVDRVADGSGAEGVLRPGDVITSIRPDDGTRTEVGDFADLVGVLDRTPPGTTVHVGVERDGAEEVLEVVTMAPPAPATPDVTPAGGSLLGIGLAPDVELPVDISFDIDDIGGPSAGTMFALGIVDMLTPGEMTGGEVVAGTGTVDLAGDVGAIGGVRQKMVGAQRDGAQWFIAPTENCDEVRGYVPAGLTVVAVSTLADAREAVEAIGAGEAGGLPGC